MDIQLSAEDFTFAGIEAMLMNGLTTLIATISVVGLLLLVILELCLGWNYFKLLLETVERYIVVGVLCYTSPLAYSMGASKATTPVFRSWCRIQRPSGTKQLLLVMQSLKPAMARAKHREENANIGDSRIGLFSGSAVCLSKFENNTANAVEYIPVEVGFTAEGYFCVRMPALLPKKESGTVDYIRGYMYPAKFII